MRDIRNDLRERLASIGARYADEMVRYDEQREALERSHTEAISLLDRERSAIQQMLDFEERRDGMVPEGSGVRSRALVPLLDFLIAKVHTHGPIDKDELRAEASAAGYFEEGNGRTFHTTLMNVSKGGKIRRLPDGRYAAPEMRAGSLFGIESEEGEMRTVM